MQPVNIIKGQTEDDVWQQISQQFLGEPEPLAYAVVIEQGDERINIDIDIDLGGGFESGYETTSFTAEITEVIDFEFAIHEESFIDEIGKFFGMQDVVVGYKEFDKQLIIKTNDAVRLKEIFAEEVVRSVIQQLKNFTFGTVSHHSPESGLKQPFLELLIETGITDVNTLREIYHAYHSVLTNLIISCNKLR